jgi:hypothetical protein
MRRHAPSLLFTILVALSLLFLGSEQAFSAGADLTGTWINKGEWAGTISVKQTGQKVTWKISSNNKLYSQTFSGKWSGKYVVGGFTQTEPKSTPQSYKGSITIFLTDDCHFMMGAVKVSNNKYAAAYNLQNLEFAKTPCTKKTIWPPLPNALVSIESVSNGCGGGDAGTDPKNGDESAFVDSEIPFADNIEWGKAFKYNVSFREACMQHDAAYSHAKVKEMALNGGKVIDYFTWTKEKIDDKFLEDMIKICDASIPKTAKIALNNCKNNGGFHTVSGAKTRYNIVAGTSYSQKIWQGLGFYQNAPRLTGAWTVHGFNTGTWGFVQADRFVGIRWTGGSSQPDTTGEFHGTIISHDKESTIQGFYISTSKGVSTTPRAMSLTWSPKTPDELRSSTGFTLKRN